MPDQQRPILDFKKFSEHTDSISDFSGAYKVGIRGLTDLDKLYEKKGYLILSEGKWIKSDNIDVPASQVQTIYSFAQKPGQMGFIVAHRRFINPDTKKNDVEYF